MVKVSASRREEELAGPAIFFGATKPPTRAEIVSQIPSKYTTDILIGRYFNSYDPATREWPSTNPDPRSGADGYRYSTRPYVPQAGKFHHIR